MAGATVEHPECRPNGDAKMDSIHLIEDICGITRVVGKGKFWENPLHGVFVDRGPKRLGNVIYTRTVGARTIGRHMVTKSHSYRRGIAVLLLVGELNETW